MEDDSMLCEHTLLTSGDVADSGVTYVGWPARRLEDKPAKTQDMKTQDIDERVTLDLSIRKH